MTDARTNRTRPQSAAGRPMSRRAFLRSTAAAPLILASPLRGTAAPSNRIHVAMLGVGRWGGRVNLDPLLAMEDVRVVAVCDVDAWRLDVARAKVDAHYAKLSRTGAAAGCRAYRDYRAMLAASDIDAVMVSTPDHWHVPAAIAALRAGKDVSVEKPLSLSVEEGRWFVREAQLRKRVTRIDSEFRSLPEMRRACEAVLNGRIGRLRRILTTVPNTDVTCPPEPPRPVPPELDYELWQGPAPAAPYTVKRVHQPRAFERPGWMRCLDYCEGIITNWGTHLNDIAQCGHGTDETGPVEVQALRWTLPPRKNTWNVLTDFEVRYVYADGVELTYRMDSTVKVRFEGDEGWVQAVYPTGLTASSPAVLSPPGEGERTLPAWGDKEDFIRCVRSRERTMEDAEVGHRTCALCQLGHISIRLGGRRLRWDPATETFPNDPEAMKWLSRPVWRPPWQPA